MNTLTLLGVTLPSWAWLVLVIVICLAAIGIVWLRAASEARLAEYEMRQAFDGLGATEDEIDAALELALSEIRMQKLHVEEADVDAWLAAGCPAVMPDALARL